MNRKIDLENVQIFGGTWKNFSGAPDKFNKAGGKRYCYIFVSDDEAAQLQERGVNIKWREPNDEYDKPQAYFKVNVHIDSTYPPFVLMVRDGMENKQLVGEEINILDRVIIKSADVTLNLAREEFAPGKRSVYLSELYANVELRGFRAKYGV